jgi:hypothetical protein
MSKNEPFLLVSLPSQYPNLHAVDITLDGIDIQNIHCMHFYDGIPKKSNIESSSTIPAFDLDKFEADVDRYPN